MNTSTAASLRRKLQILWKLTTTASYIKTLMTRILFLLFSTVFTISSQGQVIDTKLQKQVNNLKVSNVDTFLIYSVACNGRLIPIDTCASEETKYLFWVQNSKTFLKRFDYCEDFKVIQLDTANPLTFYIKNKRAIDKEKIKPPTYHEIRKTKKGLDTLINSVMVDHSCYHQFDIKINSKSFEISIDIFNLNYVTFDNGKKNIYYNYNKQTKQNKLIDLMSKLLEQLKSTQKFEIE